MRERHIDVRGQEIPLGTSDHLEYTLILNLQQEAMSRADAQAFDSFWMKTVPRFYADRGIRWEDLRPQKAAAYLVAQDLSARLLIKSGLARLSDYRDEITEIARERYASRSAFYAATGLDPAAGEEMLHHQAHLSVQTVRHALVRIGYALRISPLPRDIMDWRPENYAPILQPPSRAQAAPDYRADMEELMEQFASVSAFADAIGLEKMTVLQVTVKSDENISAGRINNALGKIGYALRITQA